MTFTAYTHMSSCCKGGIIESCKCKLRICLWIQLKAHADNEPTTLGIALLHDIRSKQLTAAQCCVQAVFNAGIAAHNFGRTASIELGDIYRTASAISVFLEEADARPFINRLMSMPVMNSDGLANRPVIDACTINPNIEVRSVLFANQVLGLTARCKQPADAVKSTFVHACHASSA